MLEGCPCRNARGDGTGPTPESGPWVPSTTLLTLGAEPPSPGSAIFTRIIANMACLSFPRVSVRDSRTDLCSLSALFNVLQKESLVFTKQAEGEVLVLPTPNSYLPQNQPAVKRRVEDREETWILGQFGFKTEFTA